MFNSFEITVGIRYLRAKQKSGFISFIALVSIIGIALGVATLITVLSVMNGFQHEIRNKIIGVSAHIQIMDASGILKNWYYSADKAKKSDSHILGYAPYIEHLALVSFDSNATGVMIRGIDPIMENSVDSINTSMVKGDDKTLIHGKFNIVIGTVLAHQLGVDIGDKITLIMPDAQINPTGFIPQFKQFTISGIFNLHMNEYDNGLVFVNLQDAQTLFKLNNSVTGIRLKVDDVLQTQQIKSNLENVLPDNIIITDWIDQHQDYFLAVAMEKKMMFIILTLIIAVAAFNLISTLVMAVDDKKTDIAILRTMGASKRNIMHVFMIQGGVSGIIGTVSGTILGLIMALNVGKIVHAIELITGAKLVNADVYLIDYLPSQIIPSDVISIFIVSIVLSIIATLYPSWSASRTDPVEALRYE